MSAATAPASAANAFTGGLTSEKGVPVAAKPRKRTVPSRSGSEATDGPLLAATTATTTRSRRTREAPNPKSLGEAPIDLAFPRDLSVVNEGAAAATQFDTTHAKQKSNLGVEAPSGRGSPTMKHKTGKSAVHKGTVSKERQRSIWDVMGHLFSRLFLIFIVGAGLGTTAWSLRPKPPSQHVPSSGSEVEKLEEFVAKTTKWMQVQLEVIDMKIGKEVGELRSEVKNKLDSQLSQVNSELKNLKSQVDRLHTNGGPLNRNEVLELMKSVVEKRAAEGGGRSFSLEDVRTVARKIVLNELEKHSADGIGRPDYALASGGGRVVEHSEGYFLGRGGEWSTLAFSLLPGASRKHPLAHKVLEPSFGEPGQCLPLKGSDVFVEISLRTAILPEAVTLEHVSKKAGYDVKSAPREFRVFGWREIRPADQVARPSVHKLLGNFMYDTEGPSIQTFQLAEEDTGSDLINMVRLHVLNNHGNPLHTCIYRFRVHGTDLQTTVSPRQ